MRRQGGIRLIRDNAATERNKVIGRSPSLRIVPWLVFRALVRPVRTSSELGYGLMRMFLFFRTGRFVAGNGRQERFFGRAPTALDAIARWAHRNTLLRDDNT
jgi:hypothetical protein